jgi:release factor glutamine methyltransferase
MTRSGVAWPSGRLPELTVALTVREAVAQSERRLAAAGVDTPRLDSELLVAQALGVEREHLVLEAGAALDDAARHRLEELLARRRAREPMAYILGRKPFRHIELEVDPRVLVPRPETELLVEVGLGLPHGARAVDVGTGSGAVALALKDERADLEVWGTEVSGEALDVARANAARLGLEVEFVQADLLDGIGGRFDAVLANLPYVEFGASLAPEITGYEPPAALFADERGLALIRRLVAQLGDVPRVGLEVGAGQAPAVSQLMRAAGFATVRALRDLAGHERVVVGSRR